MAQAPVDKAKIAAQLGAVPSDRKRAIAAQLGAVPTDKPAALDLGPFPKEGAEAAIPAAPSLMDTILKYSGLAGAAKLGKAAAPVVGEMITEEGPKVAGALIGGTIGGTAGAAAGGIGAIPGAIAGGAAGAAGGEALKETIRRWFGGGPTSSDLQMLKNVGMAALEGATQEGSGALARATVAAAAAPLRASAERSMTQALGPTRDRTRNLAERVVPELLRRRVVAMSRRGLQTQARNAAAAADAHLDNAWAALPPNARMSTRPIVNALQQVQQEFIVNGVQIEPALVRNVGRLINTVQQVGNRVSPHSLRQIRQIWDRTVARVGGFAGRDIATDNALYARREATNAIRHELAQRYPNIATINAEFNFWQNVDDIITATIARTTPQATPLGEQIATASAAAAGLASKGIARGAGYGLAARAMVRVFRSTGWRTVSAQTKDALAGLLANGNTQAAAALLGRISGIAASELLIPEEAADGVDDGDNQNK